MEELLEGDAPTATAPKVGTSPSHHVVTNIILEAALANVEGLPKVFATTQSEVKLELEDPFFDNPDETFRNEFTHTIGELADFKENLLEDDRLSQIYKLRQNFSDRFDNRAFIHPHGTTNFDYKAIAENRKEGLERFKCRVRKENYMYLRDHPEIRAIISIFIKKLLTTQPPNPAQYLAEYFSARLGGMDFQGLLENELRKISRYRSNKMRAQGMINFVSGSTAQPDDSEETGGHLESNVNYMKKLNIGPLAKDFYFDGYLPRDKKVSLPPLPPAKRKTKKCTICPEHCICIKGKGVRNPNYPLKTDEVCSEDDKNSKKCTKTEEMLIPGSPAEGKEEEGGGEGKASIGPGGSEGKASIGPGGSEGKASIGPGGSEGKPSIGHEGTRVDEEGKELPQLGNEEAPERERHVFFN